MVSCWHMFGPVVRQEGEILASVTLVPKENDEGVDPKYDPDKGTSRPFHTAGSLPHVSRYILEEFSTIIDGSAGKVYAPFGIGTSVKMAAQLKP